MRVAEADRMLFGVVCSVVWMQTEGRGEGGGGGFVCVAGRLWFIRGRVPAFSLNKRKEHARIST